MAGDLAEWSAVDASQCGLHDTAISERDDMLELHNVTKSYGGATALQPISLSIEPGKTTVLIGPSGCGKSTTLRILVGLVEADAGTVSFDGTQMTRETLTDLRTRMGYVIQSGGLFPHLTALQNLAMQPRYLGWDDERIFARAEELLVLTHLEAELLHKYPQQLSGGQRQRVSLMRALMLDPQVLLLDEPMGALDPLIRADLQHQLREIFRSLGKTVVIVTHDMGEAAYFGDSIVLLRDGRIVQQGSIHDLLERPSETFVSDFINAQRSPLDELRPSPSPATSPTRSSTSSARDQQGES